MIYPADWNEFEDEASSFLFYNPDKWSGNFRISAFRKNEKSLDYVSFGENAWNEELKENVSAKSVKVGSYHCAYSKEFFQEDGNSYAMHIWITGHGDTSLECSFTTTLNGDIEVAEEIISSVEIRHADEKYPAELISVRLSEIYMINEAYKRVSDLVKEQLTFDFQGRAGDLENLQKAIDKCSLSPKMREAWLNIGIVLCCILCEEIDGLEWRTLIDGCREDPVLVRGDKVVDPMKLVWSKVKKDEFVSVMKSYDDAVKLLVEV